MEKLLLLFIESGILYCASGVSPDASMPTSMFLTRFEQIMVVVSSGIRLPYGTLGDVYTLVHAQLSVSIDVPV